MKPRFSAIIAIFAACFCVAATPADRATCALQLRLERAAVKLQEVIDRAKDRKATLDEYKVSGLLSKLTPSWIFGTKRKAVREFQAEMKAALDLLEQVDPEISFPLATNDDEAREKIVRIEALLKKAEIHVQKANELFRMINGDEPHETAQTVCEQKSATVFFSSQDLTSLAVDSVAASAEVEQVDFIGEIKVSDKYCEELKLVKSKAAVNASKNAATNEPRSPLAVKLFLSARDDAPQTAGENAKKTAAPAPKPTPTPTPTATPTPAVTLPSRGALNDAAKTALTDWKKTKNVSIPLGPFFLDSETLADSKITPDEYVKHQTQWFSDLDEYSRAKNMQALVDKLFEKYMTFYTAENARMTDFLEMRGANCDAQTRLVLAAFQGAHVSPGEPFILAVQNYSDHIQPVLYNKKTGETIELISGKHQPKPEAPIYDKAYMLHAYLKGAGEPSPLQLSDLLIRDSDGAPAEGVGKTNSEMAYEGGKNRFSATPPPEHATMSAPKLSLATGGRAGGGSRKEGSATQTDAPGPGESSYPLLSTMSVTEYEQQSHFGGANLGLGPGVPFVIRSESIARVLPAGIQGSLMKQVIIFRDEADRQHYDALADDDARYRFLVDMTVVNFNNATTHPRYNDIIDFYSHPEKSLVKDKNWISITHSVAANATEAVSSQALALDSVALAMKIQGKNHLEEIGKRVPRVAQMAHARLEFQRKIARNPEAILKLANTLDTETRDDFFDAIAENETQYNSKTLQTLAGNPREFEKLPPYALFHFVEKRGLKVKDTRPSKPLKAKAAARKMDELAKALDQTDQPSQPEQSLPGVGMGTGRSVSTGAKPAEERSEKTPTPKNAVDANLALAVSFYQSALDRTRRGFRTDAADRSLRIEDMDPRFFSGWTPDVSKALAKERRTDASFFRIYRKVIAARDPKTFTYPGPNGDKVPKDIAELLWTIMSSEYRAEHWFIAPAIDDRKGSLSNSSNLDAVGMKSYGITPKQLRDYYHVLKPIFDKN